MKVDKSRTKEPVERRVTDPQKSVESSLTLDERELLDERLFARMIALERKRTERSGEPFLLLLIRCEDVLADVLPLDGLADALLKHSRATDLVGWHSRGRVLGILYTSLDSKDLESSRHSIEQRLRKTFKQASFDGLISHLRLSFHFFPDHWNPEAEDLPTDSALYPDLMRPSSRLRLQLATKRIFDLASSAFLLLMLSPLLVAIALLVKATSEGPIFFRQKRVGQYGRQFTFLKFRSMYVNNDHSVHEKFIREYIKNGGKETDKAAPVYKLQGDKRITRIGKFLRQTSLDELPQLINVLVGEMSMVGPRPAIPYEVDAYQTWHRRRVLEARPGITGLWQVEGRSRVKFDDMVRMDLRYAATWSFWLDLKILLMTPLAVLRGTGAL